MSLYRTPPLIKKLFASALLLEGLILLIAAMARLWDLDLKPPHFDEGINGWFVDQMRGRGFYQYDPENYHGPIYFYALFVSLSLLGRNLWALRLPAVLSSIGSVWLSFRFDRYFGRSAALLAGLALAVSPASVFYGRYAIHESWVVLSLLMTVWGLLGLWKEGTRRDLIVTASGITLLFLLKETAVIHLACLGIAMLTLILWQRIIPSKPGFAPAIPKWSGRDIRNCSLFSLLAIAFFYSGTFFHWEGVSDFFKAYLKWFHTGTGEGGHIKAEYQVGFFNYYWIALMGRYEWPSLLGLVYALRLAWPAPAMMRYLAIYAVGGLLAYSIIPYKTPWCIISIIWPFEILFGCAVAELWVKLSQFSWGRFTCVLCGAILIGISFGMMIKLNFRHFADPSEPYVYVQTMPEIARVTEPLLGMAERDPRIHGVNGQIMLESYYPLPWVLGDFHNIGYYGNDQFPADLNGDFIVTLTSHEKKVEDLLTGSYFRRRFHLRDSMDECTVWFRQSRFGEWFADPKHGRFDLVMPHASVTSDHDLPKKP